MNKLLLTFFLLFSITVQAQNWQCVQSGVKRYFTNNNSYLRGIRIDSVKAIGQDSVFYPFHTIRGQYKTWPITSDSNGGSWLGKTIVVKPDGTTLFDNYWNDTLIIKTQAQLSDSWIFYNDTSSVLYLATVTAKDTMTILGSLDSVKAITINAMNSSGIINSNPINNAKIIWSKNNGFIQVLDMYLFPVYDVTGLDYFNDVAKDPLFHLVSFYNPTMMEVFDYNVGDVIETKYLHGMNETYTLDNILQKKQISANQVQYVSDRFQETAVYNYTLPPIPPSYLRNTTRNYFTLNYWSDKLIDTNFFPEAVGEKYIYRYNPLDTTFCILSSTYYISSNNREASEPTGQDAWYKTGVGRSEYSKVFSAGPPDGEEEHIVYAKKNGTPCGNYYVLNTPEISKTSTISISPNPANDAISIKFSKAGLYHIEIVNPFGQIVKISLTDKLVEMISVAELCDGVYYLRCADSEGNIFSQKLVIQH